VVNTRTPALSVGIGQRIAELRRTERVTAVHVAEAARAVGLPWQQGTVTFIETARRGISAEELILLPAAMSRALGRDVTLRELLPRHDFNRIFSGEPVEAEEAEHQAELTG
jgi:hypothetical protein